MQSNFFLALFLFSTALCVPLVKNQTEENLEKSLDNFVKLYYEKYIKESVEKDLHEIVNSVQTNDDDFMQNDQPVSNQDGLEANARKNDSAIHDYLRTMMNRYQDRDLDLRDRERMLENIKNTVLIKTGRSNSSLLQAKPQNIKYPNINITQLVQDLPNITIDEEDHITEKIRSFYPSCENPQNTDHEFWKDDNMMNMYFNFDYSSNDRNGNVATATLRLYRIPPDNSTKQSANNPDCDQTASGEEEKRIRVSIYWYTKSLKRRRVKRRLADSKMVPDTLPWVELDVKQATKAWGKGRNLGLGILVEDQDGNVLKADNYFKGATCMVGTSTPKPIPTIIVDAVRNEHFRIHNLSGENISSTIYSDLQLLPTIDICILEFPDNQSLPLNSPIDSLRINKCNLRKIHEQSERLAERERLERLVSLPIGGLHIRHQRQYLASKSHGDNDDIYHPRPNFENSRIVMSNEELLRQFNITT